MVFDMERCRYYKGEASNPYDGKDQDKAMLWFYESCWVKEASKAQDEANVYAEYVSDYKHAGLGNFAASDGVPLSLKALLFNRYARGCNSMADAVQPFKEFYTRYYVDTPTDNVNIKQLLSQCRYYKGQDNCPYNDAQRALFWRVERYYVDAYSNEASQYSKLVTDAVRTYLHYGLEGFAASDSVPLPIKALLLNRHFKYAEREDEREVEHFKEFYLKSY